jgi:hypothetical protein
MFNVLHIEDNRKKGPAAAQKLPVPPITSPPPLMPVTTTTGIRYKAHNLMNSMIGRRNSRNGSLAANRSIS